MKPSNKDSYTRVGALEVFEARRMLPRLEQENIRFRIGKNWHGVQNMDASTSELGGEFGGAAKINLWVHREDQAKIMKILLEFFPV